MIAIHQDIVIRAQLKFANEIEKQREDALFNLREIDDNLLDNNEKEYLTKIIRYFEIKDLLFKTPEQIIELKEELKKIPGNSRTGQNNRKLKGLNKFILEALGYKALRGSFYPKYFYQLGIKACVYCNSTLAVSTIEERPSSLKYRAHFDVDHYHSKNDYPFLSIFLFNLYPSCAPCNRRKSKTGIVRFDLYSNDPNKLNKSEFSFKIDVRSKAKYLLTKDYEDLSFSFNPKSHVFQKVFGIQEIYETQSDMIEELIIKSQMYDRYSRKVLRNSFTKLSLNPDLYLRTLVGTYIKESEIHKRPMSKFMQDIARDLGII